MKETSASPPLCIVTATTTEQNHIQKKSSLGLLNYTNHQSNILTEAPAHQLATLDQLPKIETQVNKTELDNHTIFDVYTAEAIQSIYQDNQITVLTHIFAHPSKFGGYFPRESKQEEKTVEASHTLRYVLPNEAGLRANFKNFYAVLHSDIEGQTPAHFSFQAAPLLKELSGFGDENAYFGDLHTNSETRKAYITYLCASLMSQLHLANALNVPLLTGLWGCGAFGNDPELLAAIFRALSSRKEFASAKIWYALGKDAYSPSMSRTNHAIFKNPDNTLIQEVNVIMNEEFGETTTAQGCINQAENIYKERLTLFENNTEELKAATRHRNMTTNTLAQWHRSWLKEKEGNVKLPQTHQERQYYVKEAIRLSTQKNVISHYAGVENLLTQADKAYLDAIKTAKQTIELYTHPSYHLSTEESTNSYRFNTECFQVRNGSVPNEYLPYQRLTPKEIPDSRTAMKFQALYCVAPEHDVNVTDPAQFKTYPLIIARGANLMGTSQKDEARYIEEGNKLNDIYFSADMSKIAMTICYAAKEKGHTKMIMPAFGAGIYLNKLSGNAKTTAREIIVRAFNDAAKEYGINIDWVVFSKSGEAEIKNYKTILENDMDAKLQFVQGDIFTLADNAKQNNENFVLLCPGSDATIGGHFEDAGTPGQRVTLEEPMARRFGTVAIGTTLNQKVIDQTMKTAKWLPVAKGIENHYQGQHVLLKALFEPFIRLNLASKSAFSTEAIVKRGKLLRYTLRQKLYDDPTNYFPKEHTEGFLFKTYTTKYKNFLSCLFDGIKLPDGKFDEKRCEAAHYAVKKDWPNFAAKYSAILLQDKKNHESNIFLSKLFEWFLTGREALSETNRVTLTNNKDEDGLCLAIKVMNKTEKDFLYAMLKLTPSNDQDDKPISIHIKGQSVEMILKHAGYDFTKVFEPKPPQGSVNLP